MAVNVTSKAAQTMFSSTVAHGITPRTVATWSALVPRTPRVLVPIHLDALVIRPNAAQTVWADCRMKDPPAGAAEASRRDLLPPPFTNKEGTRAPGVYLHWALPDALARGQASGSDVTFPAIPDRWLVMRFYPSGLINERRATEGWVLRAGDYPADGTLPQPIPLSQWKETGANETSTDEITAMGRGDAAWSAYYDNVENRLGFYDSLADIRQGPLAYLVCGWYSNIDKDPLGAKSLHSLSDFYAQMAAYQWKLEDNELEQCQNKSWQYISAAAQLGLQTREAVTVGSYGKSPVPNTPVPPIAGANTAAPRADVVNPTLPGTPNPGSWTPSPAAEAGWQPAGLDPSGHPLGGEYKTNGSWWPELTLYHGSVVGIGWPTIGWPGMPHGVLGSYLEDGVEEGEFGGPPRASDVNVMVGTTQTDALASLVAKARNNPGEARMLEAFMLGSLSEFDQPDGPARTDALLQASAFFSRDGGSETEQIWIPAKPSVNPPTPANPRPADAGIFSGEAAAARRVTSPKSAARTVEGATPKFVDRAVAASATTTAVSPTANDIGHVYTLGAESAKFSTVSARGDLQSVLQYLHQKNFTPPVPVPGHYETVQRALPRLFQPSDPVILIQGGARSFRHGKDGRYNFDGTLSCRLTGFTITELACRANGTPIRPSVKGDDLLMGGIENGSVPPECQDLLLETVLLDPGASVVAAQQSQWMVKGVREIARAAQPNVDMAAPSVSAETHELAGNFAVEQTAWWSTRDPRVDHGPLLANSGYVGTLPSVVAVTMPRQPWAPIHLDWEVQYVPSANGVDDWTLDENDFLPVPDKLPSADAEGVTLKGRAHLTAGVADTVAAAVRQSLAQAALSGGSGSIDPGKREAFLSQYSQNILAKVQTISMQFKAPVSRPTGGAGATQGISQIDRTELDDIASALENMDVLCGALDAFHQQLRGGIAGDGTTTLSDGQSVPDPFFPMRAGFLRIVRLRLVDGFGQTLDLAGSSDQSAVQPELINASIPMELDNHPNLQLLPPRFTSPSRLWLRFADAAGATNPDGSAVQANATINPICGFLLPNHLDGALEFFDTNGQNQGVLRPDAVAGVAWEDSPGLPSTVGQTPERAIVNQFSAGIARGLLDWGTADADLGEGVREDALSAFLRIIDSTLWSVDPFGHHGDEHLSLLIGHPVAVVRASVRLEVQEPITLDVINKIALPLRLGALKHWQDGLLGYFINDDYRAFYCSDAAVAGFAREIGPGQGFLQQINAVEGYYQQFADDLGADVTEGSSAPPPTQGRAPVNHPYVNDSGLLTIRPNQEIRLTLLVEPQALVHGTAGLLPRKDIGFRRSWIATGLANISPTFRFGPVLVDPKTIKMPVAVESFGSWSWDHRTTITNWAEEKVVNATQDAILPIDPVTGSEGWLRLMPNPANPSSTTGEQNQE